MHSATMGAAITITSGLAEADQTLLILPVRHPMETVTSELEVEVKLCRGVYAMRTIDERRSAA
jgi:hypothetical protein